MTLITDGYIQIAENVFVVDDGSASFRKSFGENASEFLAGLYRKYEPERYAFEQFGDYILCAYEYQISDEDSKILTQRAPFFIGEDGAAWLVVYERSAFRP
ncbi:hypothetical protein KLEB271_gp110 [Bacillus phage vB_BauS_KLEB27-1]|nr:hypothetical protein KLEB271_gp110 [Bacillus phage vB_BauS_KLEB27-1]